MVLLSDLTDFFKPGKTYWLLYILTRRAGIATCGLIFRTNPGFMLAGVLLILFVCYMVQVKHQPYMSTSQRALVLAEHKIKAALPVIGFVAMPLEQGTAKRTNNDGSAPI